MNYKIKHKVKGFLTVLPSGTEIFTKTEKNAKLFKTKKAATERAKILKASVVPDERKS